MYKYKIKIKIILYCIASILYYIVLYYISPHFHARSRYIGYCATMTLEEGPLKRDPRNDSLCKKSTDQTARAPIQSAQEAQFRSSR